MKAVVLAGGKGSRLFPLTQTCPKPLARVLDRPILDYTLKALSDLGITEVALTTQYLSEQIRLYYGSTFLNLRLHYFVESSPLGTAGAVKAAQEFLDEDFVTLSGDAIFDLDLDAAKAAFLQKRAPVLLVLSRQNSPLEYGVVRTDADGRVTAFREKPDWQHVFSDTVNTGIYFCSRTILDQIPENTPFDFSRDLFSKLLAADTPIYGETIDGYWCDIGSPGALYHCNLDALHGKVKLNLAPDGTMIGRGADKSFLSSGARILPGARVKGSVIGAGCEIHACDVSNCVLGHGVIVQDAAKLDTAFLSDGVNCEAGCEIRGGSVFGAQCTIKKGAHTREGGVYPANSVIETPAKAYFEPKTLFCDGTHAVSGTPDELFSESFSLGKLSAAAQDGDLIVASAPGGAEASFAEAVCSGRAFAGADTLFAALPTLSAARFAAATLQIPLIYVQYHKNARRATFTLLDENGLCPGQAFLKRFSPQQALSESSKKQEGTRKPLPGTVLSAYRFLLSAALPDLDGAKISVFPNAAGKLFAEALRERGAEPEFATHGAGLFFDLQENGENAILLVNRNFLCDADRMRACILKQALSQGKRLFALPFPLPNSIEEDLTLRGAKICYPTISWMDEEIARLRAECGRNADLFDPAALCARFLRFWHEKSASLDPAILEGELKTLPNYIVTKKEYDFPKEATASLAAAAWNLSEENADLPRIRLKQGTVRYQVRPGKIRLFAEARDPEMAEELCDFSLRDLKAQLNFPFGTP